MLAKGQLSDLSLPLPFQQSINYNLGLAILGHHHQNNGLTSQNNGSLNNILQIINDYIYGFKLHF